jgi:CHAT domain-containing protein
LHDQISAKIIRGDVNGAWSEANAAWARFGPKSPQWDWSFRIQKAQILLSRSEPAEALSVLSGTLPASLSSTELAVQKSVFEGSAHMYLHEFDQAESALKQAENLSSSSYPSLFCQVLNARAALAGSEGDYEEAEKDYARALKLARGYGRSDQQVAAEVGGVWIATHRDHFDEAVDRGKSALELSRSLGMQTYASIALGNLAWNYSQLGDFESALEFYDLSAQESAKLGMPGYSAYWFSGVATAYLSLHEYAAAETLALSTLQHAQELNNVETSIACLYTLAEIMLRTNRLNEAEQYNKRVFTMGTNGKDRQPAADALEQSGEILAAQSHFREAESLFERVLADSSSGPKLRWESEAGIARVSDTEGKRAEAEQHFLSAINIIEKARQSINHEELRLSFLSSGIAVYGEYIDFLLQHGRGADALAQAELSRARTLEEDLNTIASTEKVSLHNFRPEQIAQRLKAALLFYWVGEKQSHLWVITPAGMTCLSLPGADQIDPLVKTYREALFRSRDPLETGNADAQKLYAMLIEPAKRLLPKDARIILLPDGSLYGLSFETLIVPEPKPHYWIEDVTLTTASSLTLLASVANRVAPKDKNLFLVGDTVPPNADFPALPQAAAEMQDVEKYFPAPHRAVLSGSQATPTAYLSSQPERFSFLHFVTHGTASRARPLDSAVVLSKERDADSFKLYARDIVKRPLSAYLVTISACNGAGTRAYSGEGLVGLSWAFLRAGAHNVIGALWEVSDSSTPQLMDALYGGLSQGQDPAVALRAAKLSLLHSDTVYKKPFYWAPFQLYSGS